MNMTPDNRPRCGDLSRSDADERFSGKPGEGPEDETPLARDKRLLRAWKEGDSDSGLKLLEHHRNYLLWFARTLGVCHENDQMDLCQELFVRLLERLPRLHIRYSFRGYIRRVVISILRERTSSTTLPENRAGSKKENPETAAARKEFWAMVLACEERLTPLERTVYEARIVEGLSFEMLSTSVNLKLNHLYVVYHRARIKIQKCLKEKGLDNGFSEDS